jgi:hypothetical protein
MTKAEYVAYQNSFNEFMATNRLLNLSRIPDSDEFFSWKPCHCCKRPEGGSRVEANGSTTDRRIKDFIICVDCEYYAEYGRLDDSTMMSLSV